MNSEVIIEGESIWLINAESRVAGGPLDVLQALKSGEISRNSVRVVSLASPRLYLYLDEEGKSTFEVQAVAGLEVFEIGQAMPQQLEYVIRENAVVPLRTIEFMALFSALTDVPQISKQSTPEQLATCLLKIANTTNTAIRFSDEFQRLLDSLPIGEVQPPIDSLWSYQRVGFTWMHRLWSNGLGGILGDEMGVGKTLQLLALVCAVSKEDLSHPALVVVPGNLLLKWCRDFVTFAPSFANSVHVHQGATRSRDIDFLSSQRVILTTYSMLVEDKSIFSQIDFSIVCCDEAHELKDARTLRSSAVKALTARGKFMATGTPIQNRLMDYWTLVDIIEPGLLGNQEEFDDRCSNTPQEGELLVKQTSHRILRRTQEQLQLEIPDGTEFAVPLELDDDLFTSYQQLTSGSSTSSEMSASSGFGAEKRQFSAHPASVADIFSFDSGAKCQYLIDEMSKIIEWGDKAVVFVADFNRPRDLYRELLNKHFPDLWTGSIDGRVELDERFVVLERFNAQSSSAVLFVNPSVGGQGLDMVAANHVFHMNPAWNPAKTDQATFRVNRPGQKKETWSHHLFYADTIEERINDLVLSKRELTNAALEVAENDSLNNRNSLLGMFGIEKKDR